jgi:hypothetical protein
MMPFSWNLHSKHELSRTRLLLYSLSSVSEDEQEESFNYDHHYFWGFMTYRTKCGGDSDRHW